MVQVSFGDFTSKFPFQFLLEKRILAVWDNIQVVLSFIQMAGESLVAYSCKYLLARQSFLPHHTKIIDFFCFFLEAIKSLNSDLISAVISETHYDRWNMLL